MSLCHYVLNICYSAHVPMFLCLKNMSLKQYVVVSLCLKNLLLCLNNMSLKQYVVVSFCLTHHTLEPWTLYFESPLSLSTTATCQ